MAGPEAHPAVVAFRRVAPERAGILCDFDGTLSPIVGDPNDARPARGAARVMTALAQRYAVVAVVSGRPVRDLSERLRAPGVRFVGLYGLEEAVGEEVRVTAGAERYREEAARVVPELRSELRGVRGAWIEEKGLAVAVHFRRAPDPEVAERLVRPAVDAAAERAGFVVSPGRKVLELRPPSGGDKGDAVARIVAERSLSGVLSAGDDVGDLPAFAAARRADCSVVVAVASSEAPAVAAVADVIVQTPVELVRLFRAIARG